MFWERFVQLCAERNTKPNPVAKELGISSGAVTNWKNGAVPQSATLKRIADYFGVSTSYLIGNVQMDLQHFAAKEKEPTVTVDPKLLSLIDSMSEEELADLERYAEFILSKKK